MRAVILGVTVSLLVGACGQEPTATTPIPSPTTSVTEVTSTTTFRVEPIEDDWEVIGLEWGVEPSCCDQPAIGPVSPEGPISAEGWPADGFYDVTVTRPGDPPGVVHLEIRRWVSCADLPGACLPDPPADGVVADPSTVVEKDVLMEELTVVIRPIQASGEEGFPDPPLGIAGDGAAFRTLLTGFCSGSLPSPLPVNCGVDHAHIDWIWDPYQAGSGVGGIRNEIMDRQDDPVFPLGEFDDGSSDIPCSEDDSRDCPIAYRGPHGTQLVMDPAMVPEAERWPGYDMYGWWATLEIRDGRPILYFDAGQIAG